ncbi:MAG: metalloregulator ArsR/SmtB family transcription factor [Armatimonadetes bacterium]|nr:metalloregulator ArsR/SmtB family transcription factor [Armatimonadota bacterium]NIM24179.1 metalloregulator ArsR/SmtB family transcription factor [Armatimonadota bacterium]NIM68044.1 metalloregulator ArsR/SmtB family transcription factor [Armatimonadota bacterium]NIM76078.1 metalloregulator ArsR/SmtB family transcription factor [Armatimonadota bacterium]NIN05749.1 metalloregulator ArsR/SmtB family transcription factor [Armatimonadota bacterium]
MRRADERICHLQAAMCKALGHPARIKLLELLRGGEECVCRLAPQVGVTESNLSQILAVLRRAGLVETRREGHAIFYRIRDPRIFKALDLMRSVLADQLDHVSDLSAALRD